MRHGGAGGGPPCQLSQDGVKPPTLLLLQRERSTTESCSLWAGRAGRPAASAIVYEGEGKARLCLRRAAGRASSRRKTSPQGS